MVSWDIKVKFLGHTPHIKELTTLAKKEGFSNIENMKLIRIDNEGNGTYWISVNERGTQQTKFKTEIKK